MARIRTIKPEFFTSSDIVSLTPLARLFYVSLWCEADREGRLSWNPKTLKIRYFPVDECSIFDLAQELIGLNLILIYEVDGKEYAEIPSFKQHQVINNRESESLIPPRVKDACKRVSGEGRKEGREGKVYTPPIGVDLLQSWKSVRKAKRVGEITELVFRGVEREAKKAGITPEQAITICCEKGWASFDSSWNWKSATTDDRPIGGNSV